MLFALLTLALVNSLCLGQPTSGDIRINPKSASNPLSGTLEVYFNGQWGTVSTVNPTAVAHVACRQIVGSMKGFSAPIDIFGSGRIVNTPALGRPVWNGGLTCSGEESQLSDCANFFPAKQTGGVLSHANDLEITCGYYCSSGAGPMCNQTCLCPNGICGNVNQDCARCNRGSFGTNCLTSFCNCLNGFCSPSSASCVYCDDTHTGSTCSTTCSCNATNGKCLRDTSTSTACVCSDSTIFGKDCNDPCLCSGGKCTSTDGACSSCNVGLTGSTCSTPCNCTTGQCSKNPGAADTCYVCNTGLTGTLCDTPCACANGGFCSNLASENSACLACAPGFTGPTCTTPCTCVNGECSTTPDDGNGCSKCNPGFVGATCSQTCPCTNGACSSNPSDPAVCTSCKPGFYGPSCLPCNCTISGSICNQGISGNGDCYPDGYLRLPSPTITSLTAVYSGRLEIFKNKFGYLCAGSNNNATHVAKLACEQYVSQIGYPLNSLISYSASGSDGLTINSFAAATSCNTPSASLSECLQGPCDTTIRGVFVSCTVSITCNDGFFGPNCDQPCRQCDPSRGVCKNTRLPDGGQCSSCLTKDFTGTYCDIPCLCLNGTCATGSTSCSTCYTDNYGSNCVACNCPQNTVCSSEVYGTGDCASTDPSVASIRLKPDTNSLTSGVVEALVLNTLVNARQFTPVCSNIGFISNSDYNFFCTQFFGTSSFSFSSLSYSSVPIAPSPLGFATLRFNNCPTFTAFPGPYSSCGNASYQTAFPSFCTSQLYINCSVPSQVCGNKLLDIGEQCDGGSNCNPICQCNTGFMPKSGVRHFSGCVPAPVNCTWNLWNDWTSCDASCGTKSRSRTYATVQANGGLPCIGSNLATINCDYSECNVTCPTGVKSLATCAQDGVLPDVCSSASKCAAYPSAICSANPCDSCRLGYFVNGFPVSCEQRVDSNGDRTAQGEVGAGTNTNPPPNTIPKPATNNVPVQSVQRDTPARSGVAAFFFALVSLIALFVHLL